MNEETDAGEGGYAGPRSPLRVVTIFETLAEHPKGLSLTRLSTLVGVPKTSLLSILRVLEKSGYILADDVYYFLGPSAYRLGIVIASSFAIVSAFRPAMRELSHVTHETVMLGFLDRITNECTYMEIVQPDVPVRYITNIGSRRPLYCTGAGRALLFFQEDSFIKSYLRSTKMTRYTENTVVTPGKMLELSLAARRQGFAVSIGEMNVTTGAAAAPIYDRAGKVDYCVSVAAPAERLARQVDAITHAVRETGKELSSVLGYSGPYSGD